MECASHPQLRTNSARARRRFTRGSPDFQKRIEAEIASAPDAIKENTTRAVSFVMFIPGSMCVFFITWKYGTAGISPADF
jgi:hypothetical protein